MVSVVSVRPLVSGSADVGAGGVDEEADDDEPEGEGGESVIILPPTRGGVNTRSVLSGGVEKGDSAFPRASGGVKTRPVEAGGVDDELDEELDAEDSVETICPLTSGGVNTRWVAEDEEGNPAVFVGGRGKSIIHILPGVDEEPSVEDTDSDTVTSPFEGSSSVC